MSSVGKKYQSTFIFLGVIGVLYAIGIHSVFSIPSDARDYLTGVALPFDTMVFIPLLFYFFIIRKYHLTPLLVLPIIWLGCGLVMQIAQPKNFQFVFLLTALTFMVEVGIVFHEWLRMVRCFRSVRKTSSDPCVWFVATFEALTKNRRIAKLCGTECATLYYALFSWGKPALGSSSAHAFTYHKESGYLSFMGVFLALSGIEIGVIHLFISQWSVEGACVATVLSLYCVVWCVGDVRASLLRPVLLESNILCIHSGVRFSAHIPLAQVACVETRDPHFAKEETLNLGIMGVANCWVILNEAVEVETFFGSKRRAKTVGLTLDNAKDFRTALQECCEHRAVGDSLE